MVQVHEGHSVAQAHGQPRHIGVKSGGWASIGAASPARVLRARKRVGGDDGVTELSSNTVPLASNSNSIDVTTALAMVATVIGIIVLAVLLVYTVSWIADNISTISSVVTDGLNQVAGVVTAGVGQVISSIEGAAQFVFQIGEDVGRTIGQALQQIFSVLTGIATSLYNLMSSIVSTLVSTLIDIKNTLIQFFNAAIMPIIEFVGNIVSRIIQAIQSLFGF